MKKLLLALALLCSASTTPHLLSARPVIARAVRTYQQGYADGTAQAAAYARHYGYGTQGYNDAIAAGEARARKAGAQSDTSYWQGYYDALVDYSE